LKIKKILISQPQPSVGKSPYFDLAEKTGVQIDFRPFIKVEGVSAKDFRSQKVNLLDYTAVVFTSKNAIDHYFRLAQELRITIPDTMKYFCISEERAHYLQKYIVYRKRKIFYGTGKFPELLDVMQKHKGEKFLLPMSDVHVDEGQELMKSQGFDFTEAIMYRTVSNDLTDIGDLSYDIVVFFSPSGIESLLKNFPDFKQNDLKIGAFGPRTAKAVIDSGLRLDLQAPNPKAPSITTALEQFITEHNKAFTR